MAGQVLAEMFSQRRYYERLSDLPPPVSGAGIGERLR